MKKIIKFFVINTIIISVVLFFPGCLQFTHSAETTETTTEQTQATETTSGKARQILQSAQDVMFLNQDVNFAFVYPQPLLTLSSIQYINPGYSDMLLTVNISKIEDLCGTLGYDSKTAKKDKEELAEGGFGEDIDFAYEPSKNVTRVGDTYVKDFIVFARFDVCDITFERIAIFYNNDTQVVINLKADKDKIIESMGNYFTVDKENCSNMKVWDFDKQDEFYQKVSSGKASGLAQLWYDSFNLVMDLLQINDFKGASAGYNRVIDKRTYEQDKDLNYIISAAYPELMPANTAGLDDTLNSNINDTVQSSIEDFKGEVENQTTTTDNGEPNNYMFTIDYSVVRFDDNIASIYLVSNPYLGGAHGMTYFNTYNYDLQNNKGIEIKDIFTSGFDYKGFLSNYCYENLIKQQKKLNVDPDKDWVKEGTDPSVKENYANFLLTFDSLIIKFLPYQVAPYAAGDFSVVIPYKEFKDNINTDLNIITDQ